MDLDPPNTSKEHILRETAKIPWTDLLRFFAAGNAIFVDSSLDLIEVASICRKDEAETLKHWMSDGRVQPVSDEQAGNWLEHDIAVWAVVVAPWVLVQVREQEQNE